MIASREERIYWNSSMRWWVFTFGPSPEDAVIWVVTSGPSPLAATCLPERHLQYSSMGVYTRTQPSCWYSRHSRSRNERESSKRRESSGSFQLVTISGPIKWWTVSHVIVSNNQCCEQECSNSKDLNNKSWFNGVKIVWITGRVEKT